MMQENKLFKQNFLVFSLFILFFFSYFLCVQKTKIQENSVKYVGVSKHVNGEKKGKANQRNNVHLMDEEEMCKREGKIEWAKKNSIFFLSIYVTIHEHSL